jgi:Protein of unknown function (DUF2752)
VTVQLAVAQQRPRPATATAVGRLALVGVATVALGALHLKHRPATLCVFREVTGIPCPFCGGTTAAVQLGHGNVAGALAASPLAVLLLVTWPFLEALHPLKYWHSRRVRWILIGSALIVAEVWQLVRFGIISL